MVDKNCSLRERKAVETRARLQNSAIDLVTKNGLDKTTVEAISNLANVSPRTFFNYFDSKEDAILGLCKSPDLGRARALDIYDDMDVKEYIVDQLLSLFNPILADHKLHKKVVKLARKYPQLLERKVSYFFKINEQVVDLVRRIVALKYPQLDERTVQANAQIVSIVCVGSVKVAMKEWVSVKKTLSSEDVKKRAIELINQSKEIL